MNRILNNFKLIIPYFLILSSIFIIWHQNNQILELKNHRSKRETFHSNWLPVSGDDSHTLFLPIYAQISRKHIRKVCQEHFNSLGSMSSASSASPEKALKRKCPGSASFSLSQPVQIGKRRQPEGCAFLDGARWHVCELSHGYTMLTFKGDRRLNSSIANPRAMKFLPYPFEGTDNMVYNNTMWYSEHDRLIAYQFRSHKTTIINLNVSLEPLYAKNSTSRLDVQAEEHGIWVLYRRKNETNLTVSRFDAHSMQIVANWTLPSINTSSMCNSFIRCAILYSVGCDGTVSSVYDFYSHTYIGGQKIQWKHLEMPIGNVQYDPNSQQISIFSNSKIFKVTVD